MKSKKEIKSLLLASTIFVLVSLSGCSENKEESKPQAQTNVESVSVIKVTKNENAREIKVAQKTADKDQSKSYYLDYNIKSEYDQYSQPANKDAAVRVKPRTAIDANMHVRSPYEKIKVSLLVRKMSKKFIVKCSACHNDYANGIIGPSLLNKSADEIFNNIADFKNGVKSNPLMTDLVKMMSKDEIRTIAQEIYEFNLELQKMENK